MFKKTKKKKIKIENYEMMSISIANPKKTILFLVVISIFRCYVPHETVVCHKILTVDSDLLRMFSFK